MPISTDSDEWRSGDYFDWMTEHIHNFLRQNQDMAYSLGEIVEYLFKEKAHVVPIELANAGNGAVESYVAARIDHLRYREAISQKVVELDGTEEPVIHYTYDDSGVHPVVEVEYDIPERIEKLEKKLNSKTESLEEYISNVEYYAQHEW